jgi:Cys-rich repeat protein
MHFRSLLGFALLGTFAVSASCSSEDKGGGIPGFGVTCTSDKECTSYSLLCGTDDTCVQCLNEDDCDRLENCVAGVCQVPQDCEDSRDCSGDQVCNETAGVCVQCLASSDCAKGQTCARNSCVTKQPCDYTSDCEGGLLCDADAGYCVTCREDDDCPSRRVCEDNECVVPSSGGGGTNSGGTGSGGRGGTSSGGNGGIAGTGSGGYSGGGNGGVSTGGTGGTAGSSGSTGSAGEGGAGPIDCDCQLGDACTPDLRCVDERVIDDFVVCDEEILAIAGRSGVWTGEADSDVNITYDYGDPGSQWADHSCAAWATGGAVLNGVATDFAFIGFMLNAGEPYDLSAYDGLELKLESSDYVQVVLKTTGGGYFEYPLSPLSGSNFRYAPFAAMAKMANSLEDTLDLTSVYEVQFSVTDRTTFGLAVHSVTLY